MVRLVPLVLAAVALVRVGPAWAQDRTPAPGVGGSSRPAPAPADRLPEAGANAQDGSAANAPPARAPALAPCPPAVSPPSCGCAGTAFGALIVGVGIGMGVMMQLQKRNRKMAVGVAKDNPMMQPASGASGTHEDVDADKDAVQDVEGGYAANPMHPEPEVTHRMTLAERYGLPSPQPQSNPQRQLQPEPEPQAQATRDALGIGTGGATFAAIEGDADADDDEEEEEDDYQDRQAKEEGEEFDVVVDVKTSDGNTGEQKFKVKTTDTLGSVKRRMSLSMGLSPEQMAVLLGSGADASNDDEPVGGLGGLITAETRIRAPQQAGQVACQFGRDGAKADFECFFIELIRGSVTFRDGGRDGKVVRTAGVIGCTVDIPKQARKGHENAFRVDLGEPDSLGENKYVISVDTAEEMMHWMSIFGAYTTLSPEKIASIAEAAAEAADMQTSSLESDAGQNDEQEQVRPAATEHKDPGTAAAQIAAEEEEAEREKARIAAAEEEAEREKARLAAEKAEQERAQAEIARGMEVVREAALQRSILLSRIPRCQGQVQCQVNGKKTFANVFLELADGVLRMNDGDAVLRNATVAGCSVGELKQPRKGHQYAFRVDLQDADSAGSKKYVLSVDTDEEKQLWMSRLRAYTYLSVEEVAEVMQLAADVEAVAATSQAGGDIDDYGDDT